jgi:hypothetical protein
MGHDPKPQAHRNHSPDFGKDFAGPWTGADIVHQKRAFGLLRSGESKRPTVKVVHGVLERGDPADIGSLPV